MVIIVAFLWYKKKPKKKVYIEPDYAAVVFESIIPLLKDEAAYEFGEQVNELEIEGHVALYSRFETVRTFSWIHTLITHALRLPLFS